MDSDDQVEPRAFNPDGAVFVSYRQSDGSVLAEEVSWALRGCGLPVWRDKQDLLPGDFNERIRQAFDEGISAAVVVITPDIAHSQVVKTVEVPQLLALHQLEPRFSLAILNAVATDGGRLDYAAPDSLLDIEGAYLKDTKQYAHAGAGIKELSVEMARRRMIEFSRTNDSVLPIDIQTRTWPQASDARRGLVVRLRPSADAARVPRMDAYRNFQTFLSACPQLLSASGADRVEVSGGAHLSMVADDGDIVR